MNYGDPRQHRSTRVIHKGCAILRGMKAAEEEDDEEVL